MIGPRKGEGGEGGEGVAAVARAEKADRERGKGTTEEVKAARDDDGFIQERAMRADLDRGRTNPTGAGGQARPGGPYPRGQLTGTHYTICKY